MGGIVNHIKSADVGAVNEGAMDVHTSTEEASVGCCLCFPDATAHADEGRNYHHRSSSKPGLDRNPLL